MGVARRRLDMGVPEQRSDHWQGLSKRQRPGSEGVAQVVSTVIQRSWARERQVPGEALDFGDDATGSLPWSQV